MSNTEVYRAFREFKDEHGHAKAREVLQRVAGVNTVHEVPDDKEGAVIAAFKANGAPASTRHNSRTESGSKPVVLDHKKIFEHWNSFTGKRGE